VSLTLYAQSGITPIPKTLSYAQEQAKLGKELFKDPILSKGGTTSCSSCHNLEKGGASATTYSFGVEGKETKVNTPTVFNSVFNFVQFYDGRAKDLKEQTSMGLADKMHMNMKIDDLIVELKKSKYNEKFETLFKDGLTKENFLNVMVEFQKALITPNSRFDKFLRGDTSELSTQEKQGYKDFKASGCINCHNGVNMGSNMYQKMGIFTPFRDEKVTNGRFNVTARERDRYVYKVPTLRNIAQTAPYFHDGSAKTLTEAVSRMFEYQLGIKADSKKVASIVTFLKTLDGEKPKILKGDK